MVVDPGRLALRADLNNLRSTVDSMKIKQPTPRFAQAKRDARKLFDSLAREGLLSSTDTASFKRWLGETQVNARSSYLSHKNPSWDGLTPAVYSDSGWTSLATSRGACSIVTTSSMKRISVRPENALRSTRSRGSETGRRSSRG